MLKKNQPKGALPRNNSNAIPSLVIKHPSQRSAKPKAAAELLSQTLRAFGLEKKAERYAAFPRWEEIVGAEIASVAIPERISRGNVLIVRVLDAAWSQELSMQKQELLAKLQAVDIGAVVDDLRFITGDPRAIQKR
jgi:predicted nucleic acid-binding Zn ribbon protein